MAAPTEYFRMAAHDYLFKRIRKSSKVSTENFPVFLNQQNVRIKHHFKYRFKKSQYNEIVLNIHLATRPFFIVTNTSIFTCKLHIKRHQ